ncbi:helix-turn-helix domain-containing protein [Psychrobacillus sp. FJAT-21963]|uniref:helix-turn-helix domain-containing protein n=1 Tax=Psychrobacillus sp. FJAT-21963 TaxID=1712028 RepID=UPI0006F8E640|nr:helix-turn-helix transcriptional regulator [Psychrobacillus sp. FJAT-21963]KQL33341.1 hypothetical protein AN959_17410 [Psychrobacillus sp. FJAT-21963]
MSKENEENSRKEYLGEKLKNARKRKGISLSDLAIATGGVTVPLLSRIENNAHINPGIITFKRICYALDLSDTDILQIIKSLDS